MVSSMPWPALYPRERPGTHCTGGWVGLRAGLDVRKISSPPGFDPRTVQPVAQSLYRLSYPAHNDLVYVLVFFLILFYTFLISNFRRVLNVVYFLLGNSQASELYMPTFRNTLFHLLRRVGIYFIQSLC